MIVSKQSNAAVFVSPGGDIKTHLQGGAGANHGHHGRQQQAPQGLDHFPVVKVLVVGAVQEAQLPRHDGRERVRRLGGLRRSHFWAPRRTQKLQTVQLDGGRPFRRRRNDARIKGLSN